MCRRARDYRGHGARPADDGLRSRGVVLLLAELTAFRAMAPRESLARSAAPGVARAGGMPPSAKRAALTAMWIAVLLSSTVLLHVHWAAAVVTLGLGAVGTLAILFGVRTVPDFNPPPHAR